MVADGRLGEVEGRGQVADADLAALVRADQGHQPDPDRVAEGLEYLRQAGGGGLADGLADQRDRAASTPAPAAAAGRSSSVVRLACIDMPLS